MQEYVPVKQGKVREIYDVGDALVIVATDRISCFDVILKNVITNKGKVLNQMSRFWFDYTKDIVPNHMISTDTNDMPEFFRNEKFEGRSMLVKKLTMLPVECIVRGYLVGSGWKDYCKSGAVSGIKLRPGYRQAEKLDEPLFTPSTKAAVGDHDEAISFEQVAQLVGEETAARMRDLSLTIYRTARDYAEDRGIIVADTKFEFGEIDGKLTLVDEVLTPDSSRFWPKESYRVGESPVSLDKQFVRDYLETLDWNKTAPGPSLPDEVVAKTAAKYREALAVLTK